MGARSRRARAASTTNRPAAAYLTINGRCLSLRPFDIMRFISQARRPSNRPVRSRRDRDPSYPPAREKSIPRRSDPAPDRRGAAGILWHTACVRTENHQGDGPGFPRPSNLRIFGLVPGVREATRRNATSPPRIGTRNERYGKGIGGRGDASASGRAAAPRGDATPRPRGPRRPREKGGPLMKDPRTTESSQCVACGGRLRNAVFCPVCGHSSCSWTCSMRHTRAAFDAARTPLALPGRLLA